MEYRKEQTFIVAYDANNTLRGKWNILTNEYIGVRGNPIKSAPEAFKINNNTDIPQYIENVLRMISENKRSTWRPYNENRAKRVEQLLSLQLTVEPSWGTWDFISHDSTRLTKDLVQYLQDECEGIYNEKNITDYKFYKENKGFIDKCGDQREWAIGVLVNCAKRGQKTPDDFIKGMILRGIHERVYTVKTSYDFYNILTLWKTMIAELGDTLEVKHNILTNYAILKYLYEEYRDKHYDEGLKRNNDLAWLYFEDDEYIVHPLLTRKEFHEEAEAQNNCVERLYMEKVYSGHTHVVVVRKKSNPSKSYITCEVNRQGKIWQYLYRFNKPVCVENDIHFKLKYQDHLLSSLKG